MPVKIVVTDGATLNPGDNPWTPIESLGVVTVFEHTEPDQVPERLSGAAVAVVNKVRLSRSELQQLPDLRMVAVTATGFDIVDVKSAAEFGVVVSNVPSYGTESVSQFAFAQILQLCHQISLHDAAIRRGEWKERGEFSFWLTPQTELAGLTLGILGFGRIGRQTGVLGNAFGMRVLACDPHQANPPEYRPFEWMTIDQLASQSDIVVLHSSLTPGAPPLVDAQFLARMKPRALLINPARGGLVDEQALALALNEGRIAGAALDVVSREPIEAENPLFTARNCVLTPHMAWSTLAARRRLLQTSADNIEAFLRGQPTNVVT